MQAIDIAIQYDTLIRLNVSHSFFGEEKPDIFSWQPTAETLAFLRQMGVLIRYQADSIVLLAASQEAPTLKKLEENPAFTLSFAIYTENLYFTHFSNLPLELKGKTFYFHNQQLKSKTNFLHPAEYAAQTDLVPIGAGKVVISEQKAGSICTLAHNHLPETQDITANENGEVLAYLQDMPFGLYTIANKQKTALTFLHTPQTTGKVLIGWVDITITADTTKEWLASFGRQEKVIAKQYQIKFESRSTYWRYYFVPKYAGNLNNTEIESNGLGIQFEKPTQVILPNGLEAICFEAKNAISLQKRTRNAMQLVRKKDNKGNAIKQVLCKVPHPTFEGLRAESRQIDAKVFSEQIIYV